MTDTANTNPSERPAELVDRVRLELARRRALAAALRPPKRRAAKQAPAAPRPTPRAS